MDSMSEDLSCNDRNLPPLGLGRGQRSWFCKAGDDRGLISFRAVDAPLLRGWLSCSATLCTCRAACRQACRQVGRVRDAGWWLVRARDTTTNNSTTASSPTFPLQQLPLPALPTLHVSSLSLLRWDRMHARVLACGHEAARGRAAFRARWWLRGSSRAAKAIS